MDILFARHGNTFAPGDKVVWVGRETDLPLVPKGEDQARRVAAAILRSGCIPDVIITAKLKRTTRFAEIVAGELGLPQPEPDSRLDEIDYGPWAGLTNDEISATGDRAAAALAAWGAHDIWPAGFGWRPDEAAIKAAVAAFIAEKPMSGLYKRPLVVSSNGILRFLGRALAPNATRASFKMRTGHLGRIVQNGNEARLTGWDQSPDDFKAAD
jgi:probable phosphoglycerate mutase